MKPALFDYIRPKSLEEALIALSEGEEATVIAGGQSLLPMLNLRVALAERLVDISRLHELRTVSEGEQTFSCGALVTHAAIEDGLGRDAFNGLLQKIASKIAYRAVRNMGTIGGSLSLCDPSADWPVCLLALGANVVLASREGERCLPIEDFLVDAYTTALEPGELLVRIAIPKQGNCAWGVSKVNRKSGAFADSLAIAILGNEDQPARVALGGTASCARLLADTSALLNQQPDIGTDALSSAIANDVAAVHQEATPYQLRCHIHTATCAIAEARSWSR
ncbi:FAD binding domain-containing protein (plasmid) [Rhizobium sp. TRM96647]|uniref:FAD binding domain-containing protein n=1 Tax=unclassified Rhizobium TaxID=2613769 RepID=UPI0021E9773D|nr:MULTISPECIES: FAD binding domain-containing protein [unclassified Rhizobium]MCV3735192.1 FAD binding domain-containing protein [Rhizobium sp. TRM96647]MCV3758045.1 FAD binding domain-containing protein [Rhizobium sp. TRM96650]